MTVRRRGSGGTAPPVSAAFRLLLPALFAAGFLLDPQGASAGTVPVSASGPVRRFDALVQAGDRVFCLGGHFLKAGSDSVLLNGRPIARGVQYTFDADQGCVFLKEAAFTDSLILPATLTVHYQALPIALLPVYAHRDLVGGRTDLVPPHADSLRVDPRATADWTSAVAAASTAAAVEREAAADTAARSFPVRPVSASPDGSHGSPELDLSGSKTFAFELGSNRDLSLRQTLDLKVTGKVSHDVKLRAILSDRNLPFQPEGNTAELEELDKILIEVEGPGARLGLGDQDLRVDGGTLARFSRRLQGLLGDVKGHSAEGHVVAAAEKGEFRTYEFLGTEGKQGPYPLADRAGGRGIVVVAGSERVWVDGIEMRRGVDNDYTIDYGRAEITFTPRKVITADTRIAVDYEFSATGYRRNLYLASGRNQMFGGRLQVGFQTTRESDNGSRPVAGELTEAERAQLAAAGDSTVTGGSGIRLVDPGTGRYRQAYDAENSRSYYSYVGPGLGDYEITFIKIGDGVGDYADSLAGADTVFVYRGPNTGSWAPAGGLTQPVTTTLGHVNVALDVPGAVVASGEFAVSGRDLNTLSPLDDDDNEGSAGRFDVRSSPVPLRIGGTGLGAVEFKGEIRNLSSNFATLGRIDPAFTYDRDWNLADRQRSIAENRRSAGGAWHPVPGATVSGEFGALSGGGRGSNRRLYGLERTGTTFGALQVLRVDSDVDTTAWQGRLDRETARTGTRLWKFAPGLYYEREERVTPESGTGGRYTLGGGDLSVGPFGPLTLSVGTEARDTDARSADSLWSKVARAQTHRGSFTLSGSTLSASGIYQARDVSQPDAGRTRTNLATLDLAQRSRNAAFVTNVHYQVVTTGLELRTRELRFVGDGEGHYDEFGNVFPGGGYEIFEGPLGEESLTTDLDLSLRAEMNPYRAAPAAGHGLLYQFMKNVGWEGTFRIEEQSLLPLGSPSVLFDPSSYQKPGSTLRGRLQVRQELEIFPENRFLTIKIKEDLDDVANYQYTNFREDRTEHLFGLGFLSAPARFWTAEIEGRLGTRSQTVTVAETGQERQADVKEARGAVSWRPVESTRTSLEGTWRLEDGATGGQATSFDLVPRVSHNVGTGGRVDLSGRWVIATREDGYTGIGGFSSVYLQDRIELTLNGDYRLQKWLTVGAGLTGRRYEGSSTVIDGRTEVRAYF